MVKNDRQIIIGITGGIAAYKTCDLVSSLIKQDYAIRCIMTECATKFITPLTFQSLSQERVFVDQFEYNPYKGPLHISLVDFAQLIVVMPATANFISKVAVGMADDLLTSVVLSSPKPLIVVPAMNTEMWNKAVTQENVRKLKERGIIFVGPVSGRLSCGTTGIGHVALVADVIKAINKVIEK
ncbi:MAG: phosphopantothenoylcysteine decarboxylase [Candidatus Omnitrophica bacterium]|nr:phosphopantothenoylcysteine decarboxylase [Candidatus Omnitrophota bacterium]